MNEEHPDSPADKVDMPPAVLPSAADKPNEMIRLHGGDRLILGLQVDTNGSHHYYVAPRSMSNLGGVAKKATWYLGDAAGWAQALSAFAKDEPRQAAAYARSLGLEPIAPGAPAPPVPLLTIPTIPGREIEAVAGLAIGSVVIARNLFSDFGSDVKSAVGGRLGGMESAIAGGVQEARQQIYEDAGRLRADAVVGVTVRLESVTDKAQAVLITGTAVRTRPLGSGDAG